MSTQNIGAFDTVAEQDYLHFYENERLKYQDVVRTLQFSHEDVAKATRVPLGSVRYEYGKIPRELQARIREWAVLLNLVAGHFKGDTQQTVSWFTVPNPLLGDVAPRDMIRFGRYKKLYKFVLNALAENRR